MNNIILLMLLVISNAVNAETYYVDATNGNDNNSGLSDSAAWKTIDKVNDSVLIDGSDVYFKCGENWKLEQLKIDWLGSSTDRVIIGAYHVIDNQPSIENGCPDGNKPVISGSYIGEIKRNNDEDDDGNDTDYDPNAIPRHESNGLIDIRTDYVTVQDLRIQDSHGTGIRLESNGAEPHSNAIIQRNEGDHLYANCVLLNNSSSENIIRDNNFTRCAWAYTKSSETGKELETGAHPGGYATNRSSGNLIEGNTLTNCACEGIVVFNSSNNNIIRGNTIVGAKYVGVYTDNASNNIVEHNVVIGGTGSSVFEFKTRSGISSAVEAKYTNKSNSLNNVFRNNLIANVDRCLSTAVEPAGYKNDFLFIGNTCAGAKQAIYFDGARLKFTKNKITNISNNIYFEITDGAAGCEAPDTSADVIPRILFSNNAWETKPVDQDCLGKDDVYGSIALKKDSFLTVGAADLPEISDFELDVSSSNIANNAGSVMTETVINENNYPLYASISRPVGFTAFDLTELAYDFNGNRRGVSSTPDIGALESNSILSNNPPVITSILEQSIEEGSLLLVPVSATDINGDSVTLTEINNTLPRSPNLDVFTDYGNGIGEVYWQSTIGDSDGSPYSISLKASDGLLSDTMSFQVNVEPPSGVGGGTIDLTDSSSSGNVNLTTEGASDWVHWGLNGNSDENRKANVHQISVLKPIELEFDTFPQGFDSSTDYSWSDGSPAESAISTDTGVRRWGGGNAKGFQFSIPADTIKRIVKIYLGAHNIKGNLEANLSDGSKILSHTIGDGTGTISRVIQLEYSTTTDGQLLTVKYSKDPDDSSGWISLEAATLQGGESVGSLVGSTRSSNGVVNLDIEGSSDWVHWGLNNVGDINRKNIINSQIGLVENVGEADIESGSNSLTTYSWNNGTPISSIMSTTKGLRKFSEKQGFRFPVKADRTMRTLKVYLGVKSVQGIFEANLSDGSVVKFTDTIGPAEYGITSHVVELNFQAASDDELLTIKFLKIKDSGQGWISLEAATLTDSN